MSAAAERAGMAAVTRLLDGMATLATAEVPDVAVERVEGGLRLSGPSLAIRRVEDTRLRGLALAAARAAP